MTLAAEIKKLKERSPESLGSIDQQEMMAKIRLQRGTGTSRFVSPASTGQGIDRSRELAPVARPTLILRLLQR